MSIPVFVFAKPPRSGTSKTRLAASIGEAAAKELACAFLRDTFESLHRVGLNGVLATTDVEADFGDCVPVRVRRVEQGPGDLTEKLERVMALGLASSGGAVVMGADSPGLPSGRIVEAVDSLQNCDAAVIPAQDGGFVLLAMRKIEPGILRVPWSTDHTCERLLERLTSFGYSINVLPPYFDVDVVTDLNRIDAVRTPDAPSTIGVLVSMGLRK